MESYFGVNPASLTCKPSFAAANVTLSLLGKEAEELWPLLGYDSPPIT